MQKGSFIVLEGPDGSGTTTQTSLLHKRLLQEGHASLLTHEPSDGPIGKNIRSFLAGSSIPSDALQLLFTADRAWHVRSEIVPSLASGAIVVCEQYVLSTILFGQAAGLDVAWLERINEKFPEPDLQIVLLPPFDECVRRWSGRETQEILEEESFQRKVYDAYARYAKQHGLPVIDTSNDVHDASEEIYSIVSRTLKGI